MSNVPLPSMGYLSDQETKVDFLNNEAIAKTVVRLITEKSDRPITIGVHGDWGAGKSSVLEMVEAALGKDDTVLCLKFSGWQFQGFEDAKIALIEGVVNGLIENRSLLTKAGDEVKKILKSIDWLKVAKHGGGLAFTAATGIPTLGVGEMFGAVLEKIQGTITDKGSRDEAMKSLAELKKEGEAATGHSVPKEIDEFRKAFKGLIEKAAISRLVVLIDDLDRCLPNTAIETLEAIRLFVFLDKTAFVVGADEGMIEYAVRNHFPDLPETNHAQGYARSYLEKLLQVPFRIPALGETETRIYVTLLLLGAVLGEGAPEFEKLLALGRAALAKPWEGKGIETDDIKQAVGEKYNAVLPMIVMSEQISPVLSAGTKGNPRQIKRFLNALTLRLNVATERGFGDAIEQSKLAKLMLAELFLPPSVFDHIASSTATADSGICPELVTIEASATSSDQPETAPDENPIVADWKARPEVMRWAAVEPKIGAASLKPYLFVIKDRKNYLAAAAPLSRKLMALMERLTAGDVQAKHAKQDAAALSAPECDALFNALRTSVLAATPLDRKPPAMMGLAVLVDAQPALQGRYLDVLEALPANKLGPWAAGGHEAVIKVGPGRVRLQAIMQTWRQSATGMFKTALEQAAAVPPVSGERH